MNVARVITWAPNGLDCQEVVVEVAARPGLSSFSIVGLAGRSVAESKERIRMALRSVDVKLPSTSIIINLSPAELTKNGSHYDLPIAVALLKALGVIKMSMIPSRVGIVGQLGLDGEIRAVPNAISFALSAQSKDRPIVVPAAVGDEVGLVDGLKVLAVRSLADLLAVLERGSGLFQAQIEPHIEDKEDDGPTLDDISGQTIAKRVATIAVAGGHHLLMYGPPGVGKTMLANAMASLLPPLSTPKRLAVTSIYSAAGLLNEQQRIITRAPFRQPHHTSTAAAVLGGGSVPRPGEISLAHHGILFLDELPLFSHRVLEALREPLERGEININRLGYNVLYPALFQLVAAYNPCPCGWLGSKQRTCRCRPNDIDHYQSALSGPILDRVSLFTRLEGVSHLATSDSKVEQVSARRSVNIARKRQHARGQLVTNSRLTNTAVRGLLATAKLTSVLEGHIRNNGISMRRAFNAVRVAQTIADLVEEELRAEYLLEALALLPPLDLQR